MELIISHIGGWSCTNEGEETYRMKPVDASRWKKIPQIVGIKVFDVVGKLETGQEAFFISHDYGYNCKVISIKNNNVVADVISRLTDEQKESIITKIKNHGRTKG